MSDKRDVLFYAEVSLEIHDDSGEYFYPYVLSITGRTLEEVQQSVHVRLDRFIFNPARKKEQANE